ncbi:hypothetical protein AB3K78_00040 [Leucobacter sp. HNU]|uniref:hypothetical protein n=1 Tax=Leucobacter sp. HNU TaxID=3236805 RepID=UPI003A80DBA6
MPCQDPLRAERVDGLAGNRGVGDDPPAEILDRDRAAEELGQLVREREERLGAAVEMRVVGAALLAELLRDERLEQPPAHPFAHPNERDAARLSDRREGARLGIAALERDRGVARGRRGGRDGAELRGREGRAGRDEQDRPRFVGQVVERVVELGAQHLALRVGRAEELGALRSEVDEQPVQRDREMRLHHGKRWRNTCIHVSNLCDIDTIRRRFSP